MEYKVKVISLDGNRKLINLCRKNNLELFHPTGAYNGYGYEKLPLAVKITSLKEMRLFNKLKLEIGNTSPTKRKTENEIIKSWAVRLSNLTDISLEEALTIANDKIAYKDDQIKELEDRQIDRGYSSKREKLINQIIRSNPLRYIKDREHALNILSASNRHQNSDYEFLLEEGREMVVMGEIEDAHVFARENYHYINNRNDLKDRISKVNSTDINTKDTKSLEKER